MTLNLSHPLQLDRSFNGNSATVSGNITFVDEGAPDGYSPGWLKWRAVISFQELTLILKSETPEQHDCMD